MKNLLLGLLLALSLGIGACTGYKPTATDVTFTDKTTGGSFTAADANELKVAVNSKADQTDFDAHEADVANPHSVTAAQLNLGNIDNTADDDKPVSTAQQAALDAKADASDLANQTAFEAAFFTLPSGTLPTPTVDDSTLVGAADGSTSWEAIKWIDFSSLWFDTSGTGATEADTKYYFPKGYATSAASQYFGKDGSGTIGFFDLPSGGATFALDTYPTYEDSPHSSGIATNGTHLAVYYGGKWLTSGAILSDTLDPAPALYALILTISGDSTLTLNSTDYTSSGSPHTITDLSGAQSITAAYGGSDDRLTWSGTDSGDVTGSYPTYSITMDAGKSLTATFDTAPSPSNIGNDTVYTDGELAPGNTKEYAFKLPLTTSAGTITELAAGVGQGGGTGGRRFKLSLYAHDAANNRPSGTPLATTVELTSPDSATEAIVADSTVSVSVADATQYWIGIQFLDNYGTVAKSAYGDSGAQTAKYRTVTPYDWSAWSSDSDGGSNYGYTVYMELTP